MSMLQFLKKTKFNNLPMEFCKDFGARAKKNIFSQIPVDILLGTDFIPRCLGMPLNLPLHVELPTVYQPCFSKTVAEDKSGQFSSI